MPFNSLIMTCLHSGTSYGESGCDVRIVPTRGAAETILLFVTDDQSNKRSTIRQALGMRTGDALCDCIYLYIQGNQQTLCFVELKGADVARAVEQVINTKRHLMHALERAHPSYKGPLQQFKWEAYIRLCGGIPPGMVAVRLTVIVPDVARFTAEIRVCSGSTNRLITVKRTATPGIKPYSNALKQHFEAFAFSRESDIGKFLRKSAA